MKRVLLIILVILGMQNAFTQENPFYPQRYYSPLNPSVGLGGFNSLAPGIPANEKKMDVGVQLGTSFTTDFNKGFAFTTMAAPELRYKLNNRFTIRGGLSIANTEYGNSMVYSPYGANRYSGNVTQGIIYISGDYMISPKLMFSGTAYKEFSINPSVNEDILGPGYDGKGLMMNLRFMPNENTTIEAGIELYEGNNPYRSGMYSPYGSRNPFYQGW
jgi:hypothetical protein